MNRPISNSEYPDRPPLFALHFCRRLVDAGVANDLGPAAALLLVVVALREDATRYSGPVSFFNAQLLPLVGVGSVDALARVRTAAVEAGWLHYRPGRRTVPGRYWVADPDRSSPPAGDAPPVPGDEFLRTGADRPRSTRGRNPQGAADDGGSFRTGADDPRTQPAGNCGSSADDRGSFRTGAVDPRTVVESNCGPNAEETGFLRVETAPVRSIRGPSSSPTAEPLLLSSSCPDAEDADGGRTGPATGPVLRFPTRDGADWPLTAGQLAEWAAAYPGLDVAAECRKARAWLAAQPTRRPRADIPTFLVGWLNRAGRSPARPAAPPPAPAPPMATLADLERAGLL